MKCLIILISAVFTVILAEHSKELTELLKRAEDTKDECMKQHGVSEAQYARVFRKMELLSSEDNVKCAFACLAKQMNTTKEDNTFDKTKLLNVIKPLTDELMLSVVEQEKLKKLNEIINVCTITQRHVGDECITASYEFSCLLQNAKRAYLIN